ncbi:MAG: hypothetical protein RL685_2955 [Pseudomonadota bacterium]|jgi:uncharacterized membrane protein YbhN (UPF0104 family)/phosphatidylglycerophosphate synthase
MTFALSSADPGQEAPVARRKPPAGLTWTSVALSAVLVAASIGSADSKSVIAQLQAVDTRWLWVAFAINVAQLGLLGLRWSRIATLLGLRLGWVKATSEYALSTLTNQVLPSGIAGDGLRALRHAKSADRGLLAVLEALALDRLSGQVALCLFVFAGLPLVVNAGILGTDRLELGALAVVGTGLVLWWLAARSRNTEGVIARTQRWLRKAANCLLSPKNAAVHLPLSLLLVVCSLLQLYVASRAIGVALSLTNLLWLGPLILMAAAAPSFFGGWGIREGASALLFGAAGMTESTGVAVSVVYGAFALVSSLPGLLVVLFDSERTSREKVKPWTFANALSMLVATALVLWLSYPPLLAFVGALCFFFLVAQARGNWTPTGGFGLPNAVTTLRLVLTMAMLLAFAREPGWVLAAVGLVNLLLDVVDGWLARRAGLSGEFGARYDIEADSLLVLALGVLLHHRGLAGPWVILAGAWRYLYVLSPLVFPTHNGEAKRSRHGRAAYVLMLTSFFVTLCLPVGVGAPLALIGTIAVSLSFLHSFWERYAPVSNSGAPEQAGDAEA